MGERVVTRRLTLLALLLAAPFASAAGTLTGTVRSTAGAGLALAHVEAWSAAGLLVSATTTNPVGAYALSLPAGSYRLLAYDNGGAYATDYYRQAESFETSTLVAVSDCTNLTGVDFTLAVAGAFSGTVRDALTLAPLSGVAAAVYNLDGTLRGKVATNAFGGFRLAVPPGSYKVGAFDESRRYATTFADDTERFEDAVPFTMASGQTLTSLVISMPRAGVVAGAVRAADSGAALGGMRVDLYTPDGQLVTHAFSGADGRYSIVVRPGTYRVVASDPLHGYRTEYYAAAPSFEGSPSFELAAGQTLGTVDFALASGFASTSQELFVVAAAHSAGANGTFFTTELFATNPAVQRGVNTTFTWLPSGGGDNSGAAPVSVTVPAGATLAFSDVVGQLLGATGGGAIRIAADGALQVFTRTSTPGAAGSYGLGIPGQSRARSVARGRLIGLTVDSAFRTNVGFLNPSAAPLTIALTLVDETGAVLGTGTVSLSAYGHIQASTIASYLGVGEMRGASLRMEAPAPFFAYATVIDNATGDSTFEAAEPDN